jgi:hypothetical protein
MGSSPHPRRVLGATECTGNPDDPRGVTLLGKERRGSFVNYQREPAGGRPSRGRPGGVYISAGAIVAIAIIVVLIILIF